MKLLDTPSKPFSHQEVRPERVTMLEGWQEQTHTLLDAVKGDALEDIITVTLVTGLRRSEILGLKWEDIDLENKYLYVRRSVGRAYKYGIVVSEPKTESGLRVIKLPNIVIDVITQQPL